MTMFTDYIVDRIMVESTTIKSFYLNPLNGMRVPSFIPGQYVTVKLRIAGEEQELIRSYTLSDSPDKDYLRITVKREPTGKASSYFYNSVTVGDIIPISKPVGNFMLDTNSPTPVVLLSAGVGITPMLSMTEYLQKNQPDREIHFIHSSRNKHVQPMLLRLQEIEALSKRFNLSVLHSAPLEDEMLNRDYHLSGRITREHIPTVHPGASYYICGPRDYIKDIRELLSQLGIPAGQVFFEYFSESVKEQLTEETSKHEEKSFKVKLLRSGKEVIWDQRKGSLLELIESAGLNPANSCRMGTCATCESKLVKGSYEYDPEPFMEPSDDNILICCAIPTSDMEIEV
jgi:hypothetical protein